MDFYRAQKVQLLLTMITLCHPQFLYSHSQIQNCTKLCGVNMTSTCI